MTTIKTHEADIKGPVTLDLTQATGSLRIVVSRLTKTPRVTVSTDAAEGPSADSVSNTRITEKRSRIFVNVPSSSGYRGITAGNVVIAGDGVVVVDGVVYSGGSTVRTEKVSTVVELPEGSSVVLDTTSASVVIEGTVKSLDHDFTSGTLRADTVGDLSVSSTSGSVHVGSVTERMVAQLTSGRLTVNEYSGSDARIGMTSGDLGVHASKESSGRLSVTMTSGSGYVTGSGHLDVRRRVTSGSLRIS